ncbi:MAG: four helix bundle protein, partial [Desulfobacterales bacterium]
MKVWQKSYELCLEIYRITAKLPEEERQPWITSGYFT